MRIAACPRVANTGLAAWPKGLLVRGFSFLLMMSELLAIASQMSGCSAKELPATLSKRANYKTEVASSSAPATEQVTSQDHANPASSEATSPVTIARVAAADSAVPLSTAAATDAATTSRAGIATD